jgi:broad specificity phosphatase PhoE
MEEIHRRTKRALGRIIERADHEGVKCLVLCTHAATNIALGRALTGDPEVRPFPFVSFIPSLGLMADGCTDRDGVLGRVY